MGIDREIRRGRYPSVDYLCDLFEVKPRTIYDDIRKLKENFGLEIAYDRFHEGYVNLNPSKKLPSFDLTEGELSGLELSSDLLSSQASFLKSEIDSGIDKIKARVLESSGHDFTHEIQSLPIPVPSVKKRVFDEIRKAIKNQNRIDMTYYAASKDTYSKRIVEPYRILQQNGIWYLLAYCMMRKDLRIFAIHRVRDLKVETKDKFERDKDLDIEAWLSKAFQLERADREWEVTIHFLKGAAPYIKEKAGVKVKFYPKTLMEAALLHFQL